MSRDGHDGSRPPAADSTRDPQHAAGSSPDLTVEEVAALERHLFDVKGVEYGRPLQAVVAADTPWRSWLEAAVAAGYVPHAEGIELALRGLFSFTRARIQEAIAQGNFGDAQGWLSFSRRYSELGQLLMTEAAELAAWGIELGLEAEA